MEIFPHLIGNKVKGMRGATQKFGEFKQGPRTGCR